MQSPEHSASSRSTLIGVCAAVASWYTSTPIKLPRFLTRRASRQNKEEALLYSRVHSYQQSLAPLQTRASKRKTLVLDLDETLVHSSLDGTGQPHFTFPVGMAPARHTRALYTYGA